MGGDNPIAHGLSDVLAEDVMNDRLEELKDNLELGDDDLLLSREWASELFRLRDNARIEGRNILTPDIFVHASLESSKMRFLDWLELDDIASLSKSTILELRPQAKIMYEAHSGIHSMLYRQDRLAAAGAIFLRSLEIDEQPDMYAYRMAANMYEELAWYEMFKGQVGAHHEMAMYLNEQVAKADDTFSTQYKIHARMSLYDLRAMRVLAEDIVSPNHHLYKDLRLIHLDFNDELIKSASQLKSYIDRNQKIEDDIKDEDQRRAFANHWYGRASSATGTLAEGITLSLVQNYLLSDSRYKRYWATQSFMRQDGMGRTKLPISPDKEEKLAALNITFDLQVFDYHQAEYPILPIEVKKKEPVGRKSLHPRIKAANLNIGDKPSEMTETVIKFATAQKAKVLRRDISPDDAAVWEKLNLKVKPYDLLSELSA